MNLYAIIKSEFKKIKTGDKKMYPTSPITYTTNSGEMYLYIAIAVGIIIAIALLILGIATCASIISMSHSLRDLKTMYYDYHKAEYDKMLAEINEKATNILNQPQQ